MKHYVYRQEKSMRRDMEHMANLGYHVVSNPGGFGSPGMGRHIFEGLGIAPRPAGRSRTGQVEEAYGS